MKSLHWVALAAVLATFASLGYHVASAATSVVVAPDASIMDWVAPAFQALTSGQFAYGTALALIVGIALIKRYSGWSWLHTDLGGSVFAAAFTVATATAAGLAAPGTHITFSLLETAFKTGLFAAGGYVFLKNILMTLIVPHLPARLIQLLQPVLFIFNGSGKTAAVKVAEAIAAGTAAIELAPSKGVAGVVGTPKDVA